MSKEYIFKNKKFIVTQTKDCTVEVSKDKCTATITPGEGGEYYDVAFKDGGSISRTPGAEQSLRRACDAILGKLDPKTTKDKLCSGLDALFNDIGKHTN